MDAMPPCWWLIHHRLLNFRDTLPGGGEWTGIADVFTTIAITREALCRDAVTLRFSIWTGMAETTMKHIPTMQAGTSGQGLIPLEWIETACCSIAVNLRK